MSVQATLVPVRPVPSGMGVQIGARPLTVGRGPANEVVLSDDLVSWHHALLWCQDGQVHLRDLGSRNGTFVNDERVVGEVRVRPGDRVRLGPNVEFRLDATPYAAAAPRLFVVREVGGDVAYPVRDDRFRIGSGGDCDLVVPGARSLEATVLQLGDEDFALGVDGEEEDLAVGRPFVVCGRTLVVEPDPSPTRRPTRTSDQVPGYLIEVTLQGVTGPEALIVDPRGERRHRVEADNRAVLLYLLCRQVQQDAEAGRPPSDRGWIADEEVSTGIWGRSPTARDTNSLHVLVHRLRKEVTDAGLDPWFIEKRRRFIRVRADRVTVR